MSDEEVWRAVSVSVHPNVFSGFKIRSRVSGHLSSSTWSRASMELAWSIGIHRAKFGPYSSIQHFSFSFVVTTYVWVWLSGVHKFLAALCICFLCNPSWTICSNFTFAAQVISNSFRDVCFWSEVADLVQLCPSVFCLKWALIVFVKRSGSHYHAGRTFLPLRYFPNGTAGWNKICFYFLSIHHPIDLHHISYIAFWNALQTMTAVTETCRLMSHRLS